jgi:hypothetical protein
MSPAAIAGFQMKKLYRSRTAISRKPLPLFALAAHRSAASRIALFLTIPLRAAVCSLNLIGESNSIAMNRILLSLFCSAAMAAAQSGLAQQTNNINNRYGPPTFTGGTVQTPSESFALYHQQTANLLRTTRPASTPIASVYPNPSPDMTTVVLTNNTLEPVTITLINMNGVLMRTYRYGAGYGSFSIDVSSLPNGMYALQVQERGRQPQSIQFLKAGD